MAPAAALAFAGKSVAVPAISFLVNKAFSYLDKYCRSEGVDMVKSRLQQAMPKIQAVFDVVNPERVREKSSALDAWLWQLRDAVEQSEDAIDELEYYELEEEANDRNVREWGSSFAKKKHRVVKSVKHVSILDKTLKKITRRDTLKKLMKAVDGLDKAAAGVDVFLTLADRLNGAASSSRQQEQLVNNDRETGSILSATKFVGREKEKEQIIGWLTNTPVESAETATVTNSVPIISVVGHGGMGKTTLAQRICGDEALKHFKVIWVTVSTSFDATSLTSKILEGATGAKPSANHLDPLQQDLKEKLKSVNFLLVLDDVWEDKKRNEWEKLFAPLRKLNTGSKILLTTRMQSVVDMATRTMGVKRDQCLTLQGLEEDENIELFNHHVFSGLDPQDYGHMKSIGEKIANKLGGCPLVTKVVSGYLQGNITLEFWSKFLDKGLEHFKGTEEDIMKVLRLSYYHLPTELQICFRYCCIFPQDYRFKKKELVQMWMGSGLISQPTTDVQTYEDNGEHCLDRLTRKSFFDLKYIVDEDLKNRVGRYYGKEEEYYVMHDLMHDLATSVSSGECARITNPARFEDVKDTVRHLWVARIHGLSVEEVKKIPHFKNLRTIIIDDGVSEVDKDIVCALGKFVQSSKSLRLFHSGLNISHFADKLGNLKHLRYIYLDRVSPEAICGVVKLYHLMVLRCCYGLQRETKHVRYLRNLGCLRYATTIYGWNGFGEFPVSTLSHLQELIDYRVQGGIGNKISEVRGLRGLRTLHVRGLENVENHEEAVNAKLKEKQYLNSLSLEWSASSGVQNRPDDLVLDHLEPHGNIGELAIYNFQGIRLPCWIENLSVKNLVFLNFKSCINWESLPSLGELVLLKCLWLENLPKLRQIGRSSDMSSSSSMELLLPPSLGTLVIFQCEELRELPILPPSLVSLEIGDIGLTTLPKVGEIVSESTETKLPQLLHISIQNCQCLTSLKGSFLEQKLYMGALRYLEIRNCRHLESLSIPFEEMNELTELEISGCPKLRKMRDAKDKPLPSSLRELYMEQCGNLELPLLGSLQQLSELTLSGCSGLVSLPSADVFKTLKSLKSMFIYGCEDLASLGGLRSLPSLDSLHIFDCSKLADAASSQTPDASSGEEEHLVGPRSSLQIEDLSIDLPSLLLVEPLRSLCHTQDLDIESRRDREEQGVPERWLLQNRTSLRSLRIPLEWLPPNLRDLSSLQGLEIYDAGQLRSLSDLPSSLQGLYIWGRSSELRSLPDLPSSLQELYIERCSSELRSLPDLSSSLKRLRIWGCSSELRSLSDLPSSLQELYIERCSSELVKKSREYGSPEWNKISHILRVEIGDPYFIMGRECSKEDFGRLRYANDAALHSWAKESKDGQRIVAAFNRLKKHCCLENAS